jgi:tetratricopeptide (TPR) repeat protein
MRAPIWLCVLIALAAPLPGSAAQRPSESIGTAAAPSIPLSLQGSEIEHALKSRNWDRAEQLLAARIDREPNSPELLILLGHVFLIDRKPLNAAIAIKKAEALGPLDEATRYTLALAYISMKRGSWARPELTRLAESNPSNLAYQYWLARLDYDAGQYRAAVERFERVIAADATFVRAYDNLGLCYEALNQPEQAITHYRRALELNRKATSRSPWPALNLGTLFRQRGQTDEAEALIREALEYDTTLAQTHYQLGMVLEQRDRMSEAVSSLTEAATLDPSYADPHYALARIHRRQGRVAEANQSLAAFRRLREAERVIKQ